VSITQILKLELWRRYGSKATPAEWDGNVYGGGKLSQRYWEYFKAIELLELEPDSIVLDIGGGSPETGAGFFAALLATEIRKVIIIDPNIAPNVSAPGNVEFIRKNATEQELLSVFASRPEISHVACVSVFEHIQPSVREPAVRAINAAFRGRSFVTTFEYHARRTIFEYNLTARTTSALFSSLTNFYPDEIQASPVWSENAYDSSRMIKLSRSGPIDRAEIPLWYPLAVRFVRADSASARLG
jgi:hypothetical protein